MPLIRTAKLLGFLLLVDATLSGHAHAQVKPSAGMMRYPDVSADKIVFSYADDLWIVDKTGGLASPLASPQGAERFPRFSPDGKRIAFVGNYEGGTDLYHISVAGGVAERATYHPASESLCDWLPDGKTLLYSTNGFAGLSRQSQLFTISKANPIPQPLPVPYGSNGAISDDGKWLAYTPYSRDSRTWKRYRGGMASDIWLFNLENKTSKQITDFEGTDSLPMWHGSTVYYLSDAGAEHRLNIWSYDTTSGERSQVTKFAENDCKWPAIGPGSDGEGEIVLSNGADLFVVNLKSKEAKSVEVTIPGDRPKLRRQRIDAADFIDSADVSPKGKRVVVSARGDLWTLPAKNGSPRNITKTAKARERYPMWSGDGRWVAYFSDATGEFELYVTQSDGRGETRQLTKNGDCFRYPGGWSPDSKHLTYTDKTGTLYLYTLESQKTTKVDVDPYAGPMSANWSHDSSWLCYSKSSDARVATDCLWVYNVKDGTKKRLTSGFFNDSSPVFDKKGEYIYFASYRAFNQPSYEDVGTTFIYSDTEVLMAMPLRADVKYPMLPKSDEVEWEEEKDEEDKDDDEEDGDDADEGDEDDEPEDGDEEAETGGDPVSGSWSITLDFDQIPEAARSGTFDLTLGDDGTVTGSVSVMGQSSAILNGKFDASSGEVTFTTKTPDGDVATVTATIKDDKMDGTAEVRDMSVPFSGTRTKAAEADTDDEDADEEEDGDSEKKGDTKADKKKKEDDEPLKIDFEGIEGRAFQLPVGQGSFGSMMVNNKNQLVFGTRSDSGSSIKLIDIHADKVEAKTVVSGTANFGYTADLTKLLITQGKRISVIDAAPGQKLSGNVSTDGMNLYVSPRDEWEQIFWEAWRIERDFFYDPKMHGVDWKAIGDHYAAMLDDCVSRSDVSFLIREMISELNVGHAYYREGAGGESGPGSTVGLLGCPFVADGEHLKFGEFYRGAAWDSDARSPLARHGVKPGQYLLEINGSPVKSDVNPYSLFEGSRGQTVELTVSDDTTVDDDDKRVLMKPISGDTNLRFRGWIESKRKHVEEKSKGRVGYIYVVNTGVPGQNDLVRQLYGQMNKEALIVDDRWNGGGQIPTRFIELLNRPVMNYWARRDGRDWSWPPDGHFGPKCMLINGLAGSGGDMFPALFRQNKLGKLIGRRTWGGLVGISGGPSLLDGASVTAPSFAYYEKDGTWGIEGHGVDPDIEVIDDPAKMVDGGDPQLDAAIDLMLKELETKAYKAPKRPDYPDRSKFGLAPEDK
ncbi:MAG: S41 family peptidase [Planctomycetota bacterium]